MSDVDTMDAYVVSAVAVGHAFTGDHGPQIGVVFRVGDGNVAVYLTVHTAEVLADGLDMALGRSERP